MFRALVPAVLFLAPLPVRASIVVPLDLSELVQRADLIAHGDVGRQDSSWEGGRIITRTVVRLRAALKGAAAKEIVVRTTGGVVHGIGQILHGEAKLVPGEEVVLFLRAEGGEYRSVGLAQGKFQIVTDAKTGESHARQELGGLAFARRPGQAIVDARAAAVPLKTFFSKVAELVAHPPPENR
jgi:hypothetical protein